MCVRRWRLDDFRHHLNRLSELLIQKRTRQNFHSSSNPSIPAISNGGYNSLLSISPFFLLSTHDIDIWSVINFPVDQLPVDEKNFQLMKKISSWSGRCAASRNHEKVYLLFFIFKLQTNSQQQNLLSEGLPPVYVQI